MKAIQSFNAFSNFVAKLNTNCDIILDFRIIVHTKQGSYMIVAVTILVMTPYENGTFSGPSPNW